MWKPLSAVSGAALLAAGGISYLAVKPELSSERLQARAAKENKVKADQNLGKSREAKETADKDLTEAKGELLKNTGEKTEAESALASKNTELTEAVTAKEAAEKELTDLEQKLKDLGGLDTLVAELKTLAAKKDQLVAQIASHKSQIASAVSNKEGVEKNIARLQKLDNWQRSGTMDPAFRSRVAAVNPDYGFVVIGAGNQARVVKQAKLDVKRGDNVVGTVVVTHIDQARSIAEIVPGTVAAGDSILPGDTVVVNFASQPRAGGAAPAEGAKPAAGGAKPAAEGAAPAAEGTAPAASDDPFAAPTPAAEETPAAPAAETPAAPAAEEAPATPAAEEAPAAGETTPAADAPMEKPADAAN
jgi:hypothetical protein